MESPTAGLKYMWNQAVVNINECLRESDEPELTEKESNFLILVLNDLEMLYVDHPHIRIIRTFAAVAAQKIMRDEYEILASRFVDSLEPLIYDMELPDAEDIIAICQLAFEEMNCRWNLEWLGVE